MAISEDQKEEVKAKVDIADVITSYGFTLHQKGRELWCCCPFQSEKTPSFKVDVSRGTYTIILFYIMIIMYDVL